MSFFKKLGEAANAAKEMANATVQAANEQIQANKKSCATCDSKIGFLTLNNELSGGERVCDKCLEKLGLSMKQYSDSAFVKGFLTMTLDEVQAALNGDNDKLEYIRSLSSVPSEDEEFAELEAMEAEIRAERENHVTNDNERKTSDATMSKTQGQNQNVNSQSEMFCIILNEVREKVKSVAVIKNITSLDLKNAMELINDLPAVIIENISHDKAMRYKVQLENTKAIVQVLSVAEVRAEQEKVRERDESFVATKIFYPVVEFDDVKKLWRVNKDNKPQKRLGTLDKMVRDAERMTVETIYNYYDYNIVLDAEVVTDISEQTITKTKWGDLSYVFNDVMGGLTDDKVSTTKKTLESCIVVVTTNNIANPTIVLNFDVDRASLADECVAVFKIIKSNNERNNAVPVNQTAPVQNQISVADELIKFKGLLDAGVLTQEEFDKKKSELLNS